MEQYFGAVLADKRMEKYKIQQFNSFKCADAAEIAVGLFIVGRCAGEVQ